MARLTRRDLDPMRCQHGCDDHPIVMQSRCHPGEPTLAWYDRERGSLIVTCAVCAEVVAEVAVAAEPVQ